MDEAPSGRADDDPGERSPAVAHAGDDATVPAVDQLVNHGDAGGEPVEDVPVALGGQADEADADADATDGEGVEVGSPAAEVIGLEWDEDLPVALGEETDVTDAVADSVDGDGDHAEERGDFGDAGGDDEWDEDPLSESRVARRNALPRRVESWRSRSASGAIATAIAMGLQQVFEPEKKRPAAVAEAPSDPYSDDDPVTVDYVPDDAEATTVHVKPWLLQKGDPA